VIGNVLERRTGLRMNRDILRVLRVVVVVSQLGAAARLGEALFPGLVLLPLTVTSRSGRVWLQLEHRIAVRGFVRQK